MDPSPPYPSNGLVPTIPFSISTPLLPVVENQAPVQNDLLNSPSLSNSSILIPFVVPTRITYRPYPPSPLTHLVSLTPSCIKLCQNSLPPGTKGTHSISQFKFLINYYVAVTLQLLVLFIYVFIFLSQSLASTIETRLLNRNLEGESNLEMETLKEDVQSSLHGVQCHFAVARTRQGPA